MIRRPIRLRTALWRKAPVVQIATPDQPFADGEPVGVLLGAEVVTPLCDKAIERLRKVVVNSDGDPLFHSAPAPLIISIGLVELRLNECRQFKVRKGFAENSDIGWQSQPVRIVVGCHYHDLDLGPTLANEVDEPHTV